MEISKSLLFYLKEKYERELRIVGNVYKLENNEGINLGGKCYVSQEGKFPFLESGACTWERKIVSRALNKT